MKDWRKVLLGESLQTGGTKPKQKPKKGTGPGSISKSRSRSRSKSRSRSRSRSKSRNNNLVKRDRPSYNIDYRQRNYNNHNGGYV